MKKLLLVVSSLLFLQLALSAATPSNLEGIKALNVFVLDQSGAISPQLEANLTSELKNNLEKNGIKSSKDGVGVMFVKVTSTKVGATSVVYIHLGIGEEVEIDRGDKVKSFAVTYSIDDTIESECVDADVYDSVMNFLFLEFLEQLHEDNE